MGYDLDEFIGRQPPVVLVSVTPFGLEGRHADWAGSDLIVQAMSGMIGLFGYRGERPARFMPAQAEQMTGLAAALAALVGWIGSLATGRGDVVDIAMDHVCSMVTFQMSNASLYHQFGFTRGRAERTGPLPTGLYQARGGASDGGGSAKGYYIEHLAREMKLPLVRLHEGAGGSVKTNASRHSGRALAGHPLSPHADLLGTVPVVAGAMGACAGIVAARVAATHFSVMVRDAAFLFAGGPPVVERAIGRRPSKEELGGWRVHAYSGVVDNVANDEQDCLRQIRTFLSYLPSNVWELPERTEPTDDPDRRDESLLSMVPRDRRVTLNAKKLIAARLDRRGGPVRIAPRHIEGLNQPNRGGASAESPR